MAGVSADATVCHVVMSYDPVHKDKFADSNVILTGQKDDALTLQVDDIPEESFPVNVLVIFTGLEVS